MTETRSDVEIIEAQDLQAGQVLAFNNPVYDTMIKAVHKTESGEICIELESVGFKPGTEYYFPGEHIAIVHPTVH